MWRWTYFTIIENIKDKVVGLVLLALLLGLAGNAFCQSHAQNLKALVEQGKTKTAIAEFEKLDLSKVAPCDRPKIQLVAADAYNRRNEDAKAFKLFMQAQQGYKACDSMDQAMEINLTLAYKSQFSESSPYLDEYMAYAEKSKRPDLLYRGLFMKSVVNIDYNEHDQKVKPKARKALEFFWKAKKLERFVDDVAKKRVFRENIGVLYSEVLQQYDSAKHYMQESYRLLSTFPPSELHVYNLINQASVYNHTMQLDKSIETLKKADSLPLESYRKRTKMYLYDNLRNVYERKKLYDSAYKYQSLSNVYRDSINDEEKAEDIRLLEMRYRTKQRELENVTLKNKLQQNRTAIAVIAGVLLASLVISYLIIKNTARKKTIAEQQRLLETQKLETLLKAQQLQEIDRMLETQEKERHRIANELHDDLGSMLATLKLNVENLGGTAQNEVREKTKSLIEETYQKVRNLSHLKNLGVVGSQGLLVAVRKMAEKMTVINKLEVNVYPYGLEERLENQLEVTLFRMIQELCTNAIKHSGATQVNIYLTQHQNRELNIMIEDNGKGFDPALQPRADGMGLNNIEKKTEQLGGTFNLDTKPGQGTTIIIDLPL